MASGGLQIDKQVLAVIPVYNGEKHVERAIQSLLEQNYVALKILVIDDCSQDQSLKVLEKYSDRINLIRNENNIGFANTLNKALNLADNEEFFLVLSQDCALIDDNWIRNALTNFRDPKVGIVTGEQLISNKDKLPLVQRIFLAHLCETEGDEKNCETSLTLLKADLFKTSVLRSIGGFSSSASWKLASEDNIISHKMRSAGYAILKIPLLRYYSQGGQSTLFSNLKREAVYARGVGWAVGKGLADVDLGQSRKIRKKILNRAVEALYVILSLVALLFVFFSHLGFYILAAVTIIEGLHLFGLSGEFRGLEKILFVMVGLIRSWVYITFFAFSLIMGLVDRFARRNTENYLIYQKKG